MTKTSKPPSARATTRQSRRERQAAKTERRRKLLDFVISGYAYGDIAKSFRISVATVRREVDRALAKQPPDSAERYIALQLARVQKALLYVDYRLEKGDLRLQSLHNRAELHVLLHCSDVRSVRDRSSTRHGRTR